MNGRLINEVRGKFIIFPTEMVMDSSLPCSARILYAFFLIEDGRRVIDEQELIDNIGLSGMEELNDLIQKLVASKWFKRTLEEDGRFGYTAVLERKRGEA